MSDFLSKIKKSFSDRESRHVYANDFLNSFIATQVKVLRQRRRWTQQKLAERAGMQQARISVMEDVNYSSWSLSTLRRLAGAFDLRLRVSFEEFSTLVEDYEALSPQYLARRPFSQDPMFRENTNEIGDTKGIEEPLRELAMGRPRKEETPEDTLSSLLGKSTPQTDLRRQTVPGSGYPLIPEPYLQRQTSHASLGG